MMRLSAGIIAAAFWLSACASVQSGGATATGSEPAPAGGTAVRVHEPYATCAQATRGTREGLRQLGYMIEDVKPAHGSVPGQVVAVRHSGWSGANPEAGDPIHVRVEIRCDDAGATIAAETEETGMARMRFPVRFRDAYRAALARGRAPVSATTVPSGRVDQRAVAERGLVVTITPFAAHTTFPVADVDPHSVGLLVFQVEIVNQTERRYAFDPADVRMVTVAGQRRSAIAAGELRRRLGADSGAAERLLEAAIGAREIGPGEAHRGFLYLDAAGFRRATLRMTDVESGEAEGFSVPF